MAIDREKLIRGHNPKLTTIDISSPLTVGNGELAFTADVTGMQSLCGRYQEEVPLCTMSQWGWHTTPVSSDRYDYTLKDLEMTEYDFVGRKVCYAQERKPGNEAVYDWLRVNPHRLNLARIGLLWQGEEVDPQQISDIDQELDLFTGILFSSFAIDGVRCQVRTACAHEADALAFDIQSDGLADGRLKVSLAFPYGSPDITASDWGRADRHTTQTAEACREAALLKRTLDRDVYYVLCDCSESGGQIEPPETAGVHRAVIRAYGGSGHLAFTVGFAEQRETFAPFPSLWSSAASVFSSSESGWREFWTKGGVIRLNQSADPRAWELERRIVLSQYLMAVNSSGSRPPQETGLTCNSWYGKMHLEMYLWHCAWLPLWNHTDMLKKSLAWYRDHLPQARENAARNGYRGARWPKMIASDGIDTPSAIATLLVWQQPHILYMLEMAYRQEPSEAFLREYWDVVRETADFMVDFAVQEESTGLYHLEPPLIPVQECHRPAETRNPAFETEYWHFTLKLACDWAKRMGLSPDPEWSKTADHMAPLPEKNGLYEAHEWCDTTFTQFHIDHPSMLGAFGLLPGDRADREVVKRTFEKVLECWDYGSLWGWDFALMAMTAVRLGEPEMAVDILMKETLKNCYVASGNNLQKSRKDLPLYLPGNGALLLAIPLMAAGFAGCEEECPGFPKNGKWKVEYENLMPYFA